jgi:hypothetical protein
MNQNQDQILHRQSMCLQLGKIQMNRWGHRCRIFIRRSEKSIVLKAHSKQKQETSVMSEKSPLETIQTEALTDKPKQDLDHTVGTTMKTDQMTADITHATQV